MNPKIILLFFGIMGLQQLHAQKSELDWQEFIKSTKETQIAKPVQNGAFTVFQISNINKFLYKIEIEGKVFELQTPIPTELQTLFRLSSEDLEKTTINKKSKEAVEKAGDAILPMAAIAKEAKKDKEDAQAIIDKAGTSGIEKAKANENKMALAKLAAAADEIVVECQKYLELAKAVSNDVFALRHTRNKFISFAQMDVSGAKIGEMVDAVPWPIPDIQNHYIELREVYKNLELRYSELSVKAKAAKLDEDKQEEIKASLAKVERADELIEEEALLGLLNDVDFLYNELKNPSNFKAISPPVQMDGDMVSYTVSVTPTSTRSLGAHRNPMNFAFNIPTKGGLKVDFSVGPVVSFGKKARDDKYFLEETIKPDTVILVQRNNNNTIVPSIAAMMHFYGRGSHWGGMMGIGAGFQSSSEVNANIFAGASYIMGKRQKLMISGGISYLRLDRLKDIEYTPGKEYNTTKIELSNVTEKVFKPSVFLSISYNLTNKVEIN